MQPRTRKITIVITEEFEQPEDDDEEYYPVPTKQQLQPCQPQPVNPVTTDKPAEHMQLEEITSHESENLPGHLAEQEVSDVENRSEHSPEWEDSLMSANLQRKLFLHLPQVNIAEGKSFNGPNVSTGDQRS